MPKKSTVLSPKLQRTLAQMGEQIKLARLRRDLLLIAKDDELGRKLQDLKLKTRRRASRGE